MNIIEIELDQLRSHPSNSNVMSDKVFKKLVDHLRKSGQYPPVIVRPFEGAYQILDGHHRVAALRQIEAAAAQCVVWQADDERALVLLATLNRLQGVDDPRKRAELVDQLIASKSVVELARLLPERKEKLEKLLSSGRVLPALRRPAVLADTPVSVNFFLLPGEKQELERALDTAGPTREQALMGMVRKYKEEVGSVC